jgi:hypothetical protein
MGTDTPPSARFTLRQLPLAARLLIAAFMLAMGVGYAFGLVQVHFQDAGQGRLLPDNADAVDKYHGKDTISQLERLLTADETKPFNGTGSMRSAFFAHSAGWKNAIKKEKKEIKAANDADAEKSLRARRSSEAELMVSWIHDPQREKLYEDDAYPLPKDWTHPLPEDKFIDDAPAGDAKVFKVKTAFEVRCARCHEESKAGAAGEAPLATYDQIVSYTDPTRNRMSETKLAQTSHVHLLGFGMMYGLTGLIFALTGYPGLLRCILAPLPLVMQVLEITLGWWGGRAMPELAALTAPLAGVVAGALLLQIVLTLFALFGRGGRFVVALLLIGAVFGGWELKKHVVDPQMAKEQATVSTSEK